MVKLSKFRYFLGWGLCAAAITLAGCSAAPAAPTSASTSQTGVTSTAPAAVTDTANVPTQIIPTETTASSGETTYTDPFAYCAAVGAIDQPDSRFTGERISEDMAKAIRTAVDAADDAPLDMFQQASSWRCMDGKVYGCFVGANLPCDAKANIDQTPTQAMNDFCAQTPDATSIPAVVTGHETVYDWGCKDGKAEVLQQVFQVDSQGYIADIWYPLEPAQ